MKYTQNILFMTNYGLQSSEKINRREVGIAGVFEVLFV